MPRGKTQRSLDLIAACKEILEEIQPATIRAVCYRLFVRQLLPSMEKKHTNKVSSQLVWAREEGVIPWEWVVDETREAERAHTLEEPEEFIDAAMRGYRKDRWTLQSDHVEVWSEKGTVRGTLAPVLHAYGITFRVMHGFASATAIYQVAQETAYVSEPWAVYYIGDWDPSGLYMSEEDLPQRFLDFDAEVHLYRLALSEADVGPQLPSFAADTKQNDTRYKWFRDRYGPQCWELDAMNPNDLRARVEEAIRGHIDWDAWQRCEVAEAAERRSLEHYLGNWREAVIAGQATK